MTKIISIVQQKGGVGKSTIAAHIAIALKLKGKKVKLIDIDPQGSLNMWHQIRSNKDIEFEHIQGWRLESHVSSDVEYIVIDSPPNAGSEMNNAIRLADLIIVPMQPGSMDAWSTEMTIKIISNDNKKLKILLNRHNPRFKDSDIITSKFKEHILKSTLGNRVAYSRCIKEGKTVLEKEPNSIASKEINLLIKEILKLIS